MTQGPPRALAADPSPDPAGSPRARPEISLRKLQIFWAIAQGGSVTRAAKTLALSQPTVSQQLAALEAGIGNRLFERVNNNLTLTEFGQGFLRHAESLLRAAQELEDMVLGHGDGKQQSIRIAGLPSALRALVPPAMVALREAHPLVDYDLHEGGPAEILDMLYARRINLALLASGSRSGGNGELSPGFARIPLLSDPYVLVVPEALDLSQVYSPDQDLSSADQALLRQIIRFAFGNQHSRREQQWFDTILPGNRTVARARSFEMVVDLVRAGIGCCLAPALSASREAEPPRGVRLYRLTLPPRSIAALIPAHYQRQEPYAALLTALAEAAKALPELQLLPEPPFIRERFAAE